MYEKTNFDKAFTTKPVDSKLTNVLKDIIPNFKDREFTSKVAINALNMVGVKDVRSGTVAWTLNKLHTSGFLTLVEKGRGNNPNVYKFNRDGGKNTMDG